MKIIDNLEIITETHTKVKFIRIEPEDLTETLLHIWGSLSDLSWLTKIDNNVTRVSLENRAKKTLESIKEKLELGESDKVTDDAGEYIVSELARESLVTILNYLDIPLAELLGKKILGNPGFDFHSENLETEVVIFGEAKYNSANNAYGTALSQICEFIDKTKDIDDLADLEKFCTNVGLENVLKGKKGFAAAFASKRTSTQKLIKNIRKNESFKKLLQYEEIVMVAVNI